jgi:hypothetical protein
MKVPFRILHTLLFWFRVMVMLRFLSCAPVFLAFPPPPSLLLFALNLPCRLAAAADALSSMVNSDLLLLLLRAVTEFLSFCRTFVYSTLCISTPCVKNRFEWLSADSEGISISPVQKIGKKDPLSGQR